jgi:hypothetical protein
MKESRRMKMIKWVALMAVVRKMARLFLVNGFRFPPVPVPVGAPGIRRTRS